MLVELEESLSNLLLPRVWMITSFLNSFWSDQVPRTSTILRSGLEGPLLSEMCSTFQRAPQVTKTHLLTSTWAPLGLGSASRHWHTLACDLEHPLPWLTGVQASCVLQTKGDQSHMLWRLVGWAAEDARGGEHFRVGGGGLEGLNCLVREKTSSLNITQI